jgi:hypothetical protein
MKVPNEYRIKKGLIASTEKFGNNGAFEIPLSNKTIAYAIASDSFGWQHVSVHIVSDGKQRTPTWAEMSKLKELFWEDDETVVQYHPKKSEYVNNHKHTLHLWKPIDVDIPLPPTFLVGIV